MLRLRLTINMWIDINLLEEKHSGEWQKTNWVNKTLLTKGFWKKQKGKKGVKQINWIMSHLGIQNEQFFFYH